jgi:hypothetical protein
MISSGSLAKFEMHLSSTEAVSTCLLMYSEHSVRLPVSPVGFAKPSIRDDDGRVSDLGCAVYS